MRAARAAQLDLSMYSITGTLYATSHAALWFCPLMAFAFGVINFYLYTFAGVLNLNFLVYTVFLPVFLTAIFLMVNIGIAIAHLPPRSERHRHSL